MVDAAGVSSSLSAWLERRAFTVQQAIPLLSLAEGDLEAENQARLVWTLSKSCCAAASSNLRTAQVVEELIVTAVEEIIVAGFHVSEATLRGCGFDVAAKRLTAIVLCDADNTEARDVIDLERLGATVKRVKLKGEKGAKFHVKALVIDRRRALISSANFSCFGHSKNLELGVLVSGVAAANIASTLLEIAGL